ncbi:MAG: diguanylate cyclase [Micromonosporaceae bacterium]
MSLRARLGAAFLAAVLGPVLLGAVGVAGMVQVGARERVGERLTRAAATVQATVAGQCQRLGAAAEAVVLGGLPASAQGVVDRGLASGVRVEDLAGAPLAIAGQMPLRPWADCAGRAGAAPAGWLFDAIVAAAELRAPDGQLLGHAYAVLEVDENFLGWLSETAGVSVGLLPAQAMAAPPADPGAAAAIGLKPGGTARAADGSLVVRAGPQPDQPLPLVLSARPAWPAPLLPFFAAAVLATVSGLVVAWWLTHTLVRRHREAQRLSITDPLTGLGNYRYLRECLRREVERASRFGRELGVLALDLDRFKEVNDEYGHRAGDAVLAEFAQRVRHVVREVDLIFRRGGEEFVILLPETDAAGCVTAADRLGVAIRGGAFAVDAAAGVRITVSIGIAVFPVHAETGPEALDVADAALYAAKAAGRDTFVLAAPAPAEGGEAPRAGVGGASGGSGARWPAPGG